MVVFGVSLPRTFVCQAMIVGHG
jgi:hypothetical protein